jgi:hypothetical protein
VSVLCLFCLFPVHNIAMCILSPAVFVPEPFSIADLGAAKANGSVANFGLIHFNPSFESLAEQRAAYRHHRLIIRSNFQALPATVEGEVLVEAESAGVATGLPVEVATADWVDSCVGDSTSSTCRAVGRCEDSCRRDGNSTIVTVPMGASFYGHLFGQNYSEGGRTTAFYASRPVESRTFPCSFHGRRSYSKPNEHTAVRDELFRLAESADATDPGTGILERSFVCKAVEYDLEQEFTERYRSGLEQLLNTFCVPCPPGLRPETFRHYEALEAGGIPVIVHPPWTAAAYLSSEWWRDYPGPVFASWEEADALLRVLAVG